MKKTCLIFLLLGSIVLPGCGDYEDEGPQVTATYPANGTAGVMNGAGITIIFNTEMDPIALSSASNYTVQGISGVASGRAWPYFNGTTEGEAVTFNFTPSSDGTNVTIDSDDGFLENDSCFLLKVSQNIRSVTNESLEAPYQSCFCTAADSSPCSGY